MQYHNYNVMDTVCQVVLTQCKHLNLLVLNLLISFMDEVLGAGMEVREDYSWEGRVVYYKVF